MASNANATRTARPKAPAPASKVAPAASVMSMATTAAAAGSWVKRGGVPCTTQEVTGSCRKAISDPSHMSAWLASKTFKEIIAFIRTLAAAVQSMPRTRKGDKRETTTGAGGGARSSAMPSEEAAAVRNNRRKPQRPEPSTCVMIVVSFLEEMSKVWIPAIPPLKQAMRFGNQAFRTWHQRLAERTPAFLKALLEAAATSKEPNSAAGDNNDGKTANEEQLSKERVAMQDELLSYFLASFGNAQRIDYGTGHELSFVMFLGCLCKMRIFSTQDHASLVLDVFYAYLQTMRELQRVYWLEPAGSKGVWGLDDYQFLPFLWGAAQLRMHPRYTPENTLNEQDIDEAAFDYLYFSCVKFVKELKTGPFHEHSPYLNDISAVPSWKKVESGLLKMYQAEVLGKFPVAQHILFGKFFTSPFFSDDSVTSKNGGRAATAAGSAQ